MNLAFYHDHKCYFYSYRITKKLPDCTRTARGLNQNTSEVFGIRPDKQQVPNKKS